MNVLVCFKVGPKVDMMSEEDWETNSSLQVNTEFVKSEINTYDESALELTLKLKDQAAKENIDIDLNALTIANKNVDRILKNLYALKYDKTTYIHCERDIRFNPNFISNIIKNYLKYIRNYELIIFGKETNEGNNQKTHFLLAEKLGIPIIHSVVDIQLGESKELLTVKSKIDDLIVQQTICLPVILVVGDVPNSYIRIPTLKDKMKYSKKEIKKYSLIDLKMDQKIKEDCELINLEQEQKQKDCLFISSDSPSQNAEIVYQDYLKERIKR